MAVIIRLARLGRRNLPKYRVVAIDNREHREGRANEILGFYDPHLVDKNIQIDIDKAHAWIERGAQYSEAVATLLRRAGYVLYTPEQIARGKAKLAKRKAKRRERTKQDGKKWVAPNRRALKKHQGKLKAARLAELAQAAATKAAADAQAAAEAAPVDSATPAEG